MRTSKTKWCFQNGPTVAWSWTDGYSGVSFAEGKQNHNSTTPGFCTCSCQTGQVLSTPILPYSQPTSASEIHALPQSCVVIVGKLRYGRLQTLGLEFKAHLGFRRQMSPTLDLRRNGPCRRHQEHIWTRSCFWSNDQLRYHATSWRIW